MIGATLFSGIGAPETAMPQWEWPWHAEIERFPSAVMAARHPASINLGDVSADDFCERAAAIARPDVLVFGSPCQSFSVAGKRLGLDDARGNLALIALGIVARLAPRWFVFENVPGLLSSSDGRDFGLFLRAVDELGYSLCWSVLDAQHFGVAQRRERVFAVGYLGDWRYPAAVLLEPESLRRNHPPRRQAGKGIAGSLAASLGGSDENDARNRRLIAAYGGNNTDGPIDVATARNSHGGPHGRLDFESETFVTHALRADGFDASEDGTGRGTPIIPIQIHGAHGSNGGGIGAVGDPMMTLQAGVGHAIAFAENSRAEVRIEEGDGQTVASLKTGGGKAGQSYPAIAFNARQDPIDYGDGCGPLDQDGTTHAVALTSAVRRLTPRECERLQGYPDDFTLITYRGKPAADGPRYKALGNSMAVPVMRWILSRIEQIEQSQAMRLEAAE